MLCSLVSTSVKSVLENYAQSDVKKCTNFFIWKRLYYPVEKGGKRLPGHDLILNTGLTEFIRLAAPITKSSLVLAVIEGVGIAGWPQSLPFRGAFDPQVSTLPLP